MISLKIVDLFPEYQCPHVLAEKFDGIEGIGEAWAILGEPANDRSMVSLVCNLFITANSVSISYILSFSHNCGDKMVTDLTSQRAPAQHDAQGCPAGKMRPLFDLLRLLNSNCLEPELSTRLPFCRPLVPSQSAEDQGSRN